VALQQHEAQLEHSVWVLQDAQDDPAHPHVWHDGELSAPIAIEKWFSAVPLIA